MLKIVADDSPFFYYFSEKMRFGIYLSSYELAQRVVKVKSSNSVCKSVMSSDNEQNVYGSSHERPM